MEESLAPSTPPPSPSPSPAPAPDLDEIRRELVEIRRDMMERLAASIATLRAQADRLAEQARSDSIEIGFQVARKILETELHLSPDTLFALVRSAVRRAGESRRLVIRVSPDDLPLLQSAQGQAALEGLSAARIECMADSTLEHGDCAVDADFGQVDGRLSTRLLEIRRAVEAASAEGVG
jgi:flagellar assembly protein FliH